jgi:hypothetical protein
LCQALCQKARISFSVGGIGSIVGRSWEGASTDVEPQTIAARVRWLEHTIDGLAHEVVSIRAQLKALVQLPPVISGADRELAGLLQQQLELMERQCALVRSQLAQLRADLTGDQTTATSTGAESVDTTEASGRQGVAEKSDER